MLHPWLSTPEAYRAAVAAVSIPMSKLPARALMIGRDELLSEALSILTECALPPREERAVICADCSKPIPDTVRAGAKYCTPQCGKRAGVKRSRLRGKGFDQAPPPAPPKTHIGSMHQWPPAEMVSYAVREVGFRLLNFVRLGHLETPASQAIYNLAAALEPDETEALRELVEAYLEDCGVRCDGSESVEDLAQAVLNLRLSAGAPGEEAG